MPLALFDLDGTLVDQRRAARSWAAELASAGVLSKTHVDAVALALTARRPKGEVFAELVSDLRLPLSSGELWARYRRRMPELVRCAEPDLDALRELRSEGWTLGIVTNGEADNQENKIRATGLADVVDGWAISSQIGVRKPDPAIFQAMARRLGHPVDGWMVGDGLEADVAGGAAAGLKTIWIASATASDVRITPTAIAPDVATAVQIILGHAV